MTWCNTQRQFELDEWFICDDGSDQPPLVCVVGMTMKPVWGNLGHDLHLHVEVVGSGDQFTVLPFHLFELK